MKVTITKSLPVILTGSAGAAVAEIVNKQVALEAKRVEAVIGMPTATWSQSSKPSWRFNMTKQASATSAVAEGMLTTDSKPFVWVNNGTAERYAVMEKGYAPKSKPNSLQSYGAGGSVKYVKPKARSSKPKTYRIIARNFDKSAARRRNGKSGFQADLIIALADTVRYRWTIEYKEK